MTSIDPSGSKLSARNPKLFWNNSQEFRYLVIGAWNTAAGYSIFSALYLAFGQYIGYMIIAIIAHMLAVTQSFITQRMIVFQSSKNWQAEYVRFHLAHLGSFFLGLGALPFMVECLNISPLIAQAMITVVFVIASYFIHKHFTFRKTKDV